jgi:hypothetical protein
MLDVYSIDQTQELQDLIDQHIISGQPLKLNNNYQIVNPVEITGTLTLDGNGKTIILDCKNSTLKDMIFVHGSPDSIIENIKIKNLNLDQNLGIGPSECSRGQLNKLFRDPKNRGKGRAIKIAYANNVIIEDVVINNSWIGLEFADGTSNATATRVHLNNVLEDGFEVTINIDINNPMPPHDIQYFDCHVRSILDFDSGFEIEAASHVEVQNSSVNNCGADNRGSRGDGIVLKRTHNDTASGLPLGNSGILIDNFCSRTKTNNYSIYINNGNDIAIINNARLNGGLKFEPWINLTEYSSYHGAHSEVERICNNLNAPGFEANIYKDRYCQDLR